MKSNWLRTGLRIVALVLICLAMITARVLWSSRLEWRAAHASTGETRLVHLGRAARLYVPGNPYSRLAVDRLAREGRANGPDALANWLELRSALLATRSFYTPHRELLDEANRRIAELSADSEPPSRGSRDERVAWHAARLAVDDAPSIPWTLVALAGLAGWIGFAFAFFFRGIDEHDRLRKRPALACALGVAAGLILFFLGLARA